MSESKSAPSPTVAEKRRLRWLGRWLLKLAGWFFALSIVIILIGGLVAWFAWRNLTDLANVVVARFAAPYRVELGLVDVSRTGEVHIDDVRVRPPRELADDEDAPWVSLEGMDLTYDLQELREERKFQTVTLRGPVIRIDDASLERLGIGEKGVIDPEQAAPATPDLAYLGRIADRVEVIGGELTIDTSRAPRLEAKWDLSVPTVDFASEDWLNREPLGLRLTEVRVGEGASGGRIERIAVSGRVRADLGGLEIGELAITRPTLAITPDWLPTETASDARTSLEETPAGTDAFEVLIGVLKISDARVSLAGFAGGELAPGPRLPDVAFGTSINWRELRLAGGDISSANPLRLALEGVVVDAHEGARDGDTAPTAEIGALEITLDPASLLSRGRLESVSLIAPRLSLTPASLAKMVVTATGESGEEKASAPWELGSLAVRDGELSVSGWEWEGRALPDLSLRWEGNLADLDADFDSQTGQILGLRDLRVGSVGRGSIVACDAVDVEFSLDSWRHAGRLDALRVSRPLLDLTDDRLPDWVAGFSPGTTPGSGQGGGDGPVYRVGDLRVSDGAIRLDTDALGGRLPKLQGRFSLESSPGGEGESTPYRFQLTDARLRSREGETMPDSGTALGGGALGGLFPQDAVPGETDAADRRGAIRERDVAFVRELTIDFTAEGVQRDRRVESIEVRGGEFQLGKGLQEMVDGAAGEEAAAGDAPAPPPDQAAAPAKEGEWRVGEFAITESQVRFESLIPQIEGLEFAIETRLEDIPLSHGGLLAQDRVQKVELTGIEIRDPYDSFITVAFLPTIFVEFSFAGLVNQRVDKIDLISPAIHVGQGLFWWIDYQRNYRQQNEGVGFGVEGETAMASGSGDAAGEWEIRQINAHFGKIVIAPTGRPIGMVPFPFNASTNMEDGEIALKLEIPREQQYVYRFPDLELDLFGLAGQVEFNVPIKQEDNNLVQTFTLDRAMWKQYEVEKLYLTVTYDTAGVYGRFGGEAYGGYAEGQFNVYLDDVGRWDAWLAGTTFAMGPVTEVVAPDNFLMEGEVNAKLVSEGKGLVFGETWGEIEALSPGRIDFTKLGEFIADLPEEWSQLKKSATRLSLETLKEFDYETGRGDLYFMNQDGWLKLDLEGKTGSRRLELYAHDWRGGDASTEGAVTPPETAAESPEPSPPPVAIPTEERPRVRRQVRQKGR